MLRSLNATSPFFTTELVWNAHFRDELIEHVAQRFAELRDSGGPPAGAPGFASFADEILSKSNAFAYVASSAFLYVGSYCVDAFVANAGGPPVAGLSVAVPSPPTKPSAQQRERAASSSGGTAQPLSADVDVVAFAEALRRYLMLRQPSDPDRRRVLLAVVAMERLFGLRPDVAKLFEPTRGGIAPLPQMLRAFGPCVGAASARALLALTAHAPIAVAMGRDERVALRLFRQLMAPLDAGGHELDKSPSCALAARSDSLALLHALGTLAARSLVVHVSMRDAASTIGRTRGRVIV